MKNISAKFLKIENPVIKIKEINASETYAVRHPILREERPIEDCVFEGDDLKTTFHLGLFNESELIGVVSFRMYPSNYFSEKNQYQLRGMAILKEFQGKGLGELLLKHAETLLIEKNTKIIWCNAREIAVNFYKRNGFKIIGDSFTIPKIGMHFVMYKEL